MAKLARLELEESEILSFQTELNALLGHFGDIQSVDVSGIEPISHAVSLQNVWADDQIWESVPREQALRNSPLSRAALFVVPQIIED